MQALKEKPKNPFMDLLKAQRAGRTATTRKATLCYIFDKGKVLLQLKAKGHFGEGHWNAPGGKVRDGETPEQAAAREVQEETGLAVDSLKFMGRLMFVFNESEEHNQEVYVFSTESFSGNEVANDEGDLQWFESSKVPVEQMWPDDKYWIHMLLAGKRFNGEFYFDSYESQKLTKYSVTEQ